MIGSLQTISPELREIYDDIHRLQKIGWDYYPVPDPDTVSRPEARMIADSVSEEGVRLCTFEVKMHRFVLAEFNTHRVFSRNAASSRAIPIEKQIKRVMSDPAEPVFWGKNQKGMQAREPLTGDALHYARVTWYHARNEAVRHVIQLLELGLHKQLSNRLLEPWMWVTDVLSTTKLQGFFFQRCHPDAQPEMQAAAVCIENAYNSSSPALKCGGEWHLPYIQADEHGQDRQQLREISAARCARVSYLTQNGIRDPQEDLALFARLVTERAKTSDPMHLSPLEHVATPISAPSESSGNFHGWRQLRKVYEPLVYTR